jgi:hypothetical protein
VADANVAVESAAVEPDLEEPRPLDRDRQPTAYRP